LRGAEGPGRPRDLVIKPWTVVPDPGDAVPRSRGTNKAPNNRGMPLSRPNKAYIAQRGARRSDALQVQKVLEDKNDDENASLAL
jgi:hypothetical protein